MPLTDAHVRETFSPLDIDGPTSIIAGGADDLEWTLVNPRLKALPIAGVWTVGATQGPIMILAAGI